MSARPGPRGGYHVSGIPTAIVLTCPTRARGRAPAKSKSGEWGEGAFCRPYTPPPSSFDPPFLAPVRSKEHSVFSTQQSVEIVRADGFDWLDAED